MASEWWNLSDEEIAGLTDAELVELDHRAKRVESEIHKSLRSLGPKEFSERSSSAAAKRLVEWHSWIGTIVDSWLSWDGPGSRPTLESLLAESRDLPPTDRDIQLARSTAVSGRLEPEKARRVRERLEAARRSLGLTHESIAGATGLEATLIAEIEQGRAWSPRPDLFEQSCSIEGEKEARHLSRTPWLPLSDLRLCRTIRPVAVDPAWLTSADGKALSLARSIREGRSFDRLPELGEALEAAGCAAGSILDHCRNPGLHASGCWVVDAVVRAGRSGGSARLN